MRFVTFRRRDGSAVAGILTGSLTGLGRLTNSVAAGSRFR